MLFVFLVRVAKYTAAPTANTELPMTIGISIAFLFFLGGSAGAGIGGGVAGKYSVLGPPCGILGLNMVGVSYLLTGIGGAGKGVGV